MGRDVDEENVRQGEGNEEKKAPGGDADDGDAIGADDVDATPPRAATKDKLAAEQEAAVVIGDAHALRLLIHAPSPRRARDRP